MKIGPRTGSVVDRLWGETKGHLTSSLTGGHVRTFAPDYAVLLGESAWSDAGMIQKRGNLERLKVRQSLARTRAVEVLGEPFRRVLYFGGRKPNDQGEAARALLDPVVRTRVRPGPRRKVDRHYERSLAAASRRRARSRVVYCPLRPSASYLSTLWYRSRWKAPMPMNGHGTIETKR